MLSADTLWPVQKPGAGFGRLLWQHRPIAAVAANNDGDRHGGFVGGDVRKEVHGLLQPNVLAKRPPERRSRAGNQPAQLVGGPLERRVGHRRQRRRAAPKATPALARKPTCLERRTRRAFQHGTLQERLQTAARDTATETLRGARRTRRQTPATAAARSREHRRTKMQRRRRRMTP
jgi:hypothetical protein